MADQNGQANGGGTQGQEGNVATAQISGTVQIQPGVNGAQGQPAGQAPAAKAEEKAEPPKKKAGRRIIVAAVLLLLLLGAGFFYWRSTFTEDTDDAQVDSNLYQVSARVAGQVTQVFVNETEPVKAGQEIAIVDPRDF